MLQPAGDILVGRAVIDNIITGLQVIESGYYRYDINIDDVKENLSAKVFIRGLENGTDEDYVETEKVTSLIKLLESEDAQWSSISSNLRRKINKAQINEIVVKVGSIELLDDFYTVYSENIVQLGSLNYSKSFFNDLLFCDNTRSSNIFVAYKNGIPVGGGLLAHYCGFYENVFFATLKDYQKDYVSDLMHWEMIKFSIVDNAKAERKNKSTSVYSFGRSTLNSGAYKYKNHWPVENHHLFNYSNISDLKKSGWLLNIWRNLPSFITKPLGAKLIVHIY